MEQNNIKERSETKGLIFEFDIIKRFSLIFIAKAIGEVFFFIVSNILLINWLSIGANRDYIIFIYLINLFFSLILTLHIAMPRFLQRDSSKIQLRYLYNGTILLLVNLIIIILGIVIFTFIFNYDYRVSLPNAEIMVIFLLGGIGYEFYRFFEGVLYGLKLSSRVATIIFFLSIIFLVLGFSLVAILNLGFSGAALSYILAYFILDGVSIFFIFRGLNRNKNPNKNFRIKGSIDLKIQKELILFCLPLLASNIFYYLNTRIGPLLLSSLGNEASLIFGLSLSLTIYLIGLLGVTVNDLLLPYESDAFYHNDQNKIKAIYKLIFTFVVVIIIPLLLVCIIMSNLILEILYSSILSQYPSFSDVFQLILIGGLFYSLNQFTAKFLVAKGLTIRFLIIQVIGALINILLIVIFLPYFGVYSATSAFIISMAVIFILYFYSLSKIIELSLWQFKLIQLVISILIIIFEFFILKLSFGLNAYFIGLLCLASYFILLFGFRILKFKELKRFLNDLRIFIFKKKGFKI